MAMLDHAALEKYCLGKRGAVKEFPFGDDAAVFKVMGKMFALIGLNESARISLKCDPTRADILRGQFSAVTPGYHLNKRHWNTIVTDDTDIPDDEVFELIDHSYELVVKSLSKKDRTQLEQADA